MPNPVRDDSPGARHHVYNRGRRREPMFHEADAARLFLDLLGELPERYDVRVHGYALMPNHYHLMLQTEGNLSQAMKWLGSMFTRTLNWRRGWDGAIFRGRFKSKRARDWHYWKYLLAYIHLNPVRAGIADHPAAAPWTSFDAYVDGMGPGWLTTGELLDLHDDGATVAEFTQLVSEYRIPRPIEVVGLEEAYARALDGAGYGQRAIARKVGRSRNWVRRALRPTDEHPY